MKLHRPIAVFLNVAGQSVCLSSQVELKHATLCDHQNVKIECYHLPQSILQWNGYMYGFDSLLVLKPKDTGHCENYLHWDVLHSKTVNKPHSSRRAVHHLQEGPERSSLILTELGVFKDS